jgi:hypothetical protein
MQIMINKMYHDRKSQCVRNECHEKTYRVIQDRTRKVMVNRPDRTFQDWLQYIPTFSKAHAISQFSVLNVFNTLSIMCKQDPKSKNRPYALLREDSEAEVEMVLETKPADALGEENESLVKIFMVPEFVRFTTFCFFWSMAIFAIAITRLVVVDKLAAGPELKGNPCGPFNQKNPGLGQGFDFSTQNHLLQTFGFTNICANWDHSPSRELTAMYYPLILVMNFYTIRLSYMRGESSKWFWTLTKIFFPFEIILAVWFRKYFDYIPKPTVIFFQIQISHNIFVRSFVRSLPT